MQSNSRWAAMVNPALAAGPVPARIPGMTRKRGRRSTRPDMQKLVAEIHEARLKWEALPLEEKIKIAHWHSTPGPFKPTRARRSIRRLGAIPAPPRADERSVRS